MGEKEKMKSFSEEHPELVSEWSSKNKENPDEVTYGSNKVVWWEGKCGHLWDAKVKARSKGEGCPICSGKRVVKGINDFATMHPDLVKEWSNKNPFGPSNVTEKSSLTVIWKCKENHEWKAIIKNRAQGSGCPICTNKKIKVGFNDLATVRPEIAAQWSPRNRTKPTSVLPYSNKKAWWVCPSGHEYKSLISSRSRGSECPICARTVIKAGMNDLLTEYPKIAKEWSKRNKLKEPKGISAKSREVAWWKCSACKSEWQIAIYKRIKGSKCPVCAKMAKKIDDKARRNRKNIDARFNKLLPDLAISMHAKDNEITVKRSFNASFGVKLEYFYPDYNAALILPNSAYNNLHRHKLEGVINDLCAKNGINVVRILKRGDLIFDSCICIQMDNNSADAWEEALSSAIRLLGIPGSLDLVKNFEKMFHKYCEEYEKL